MIPDPTPTHGPFRLRRSLSDPWLYALAAGFLLAFLFGTHRVNDSDMGFHLRCGQCIFQNHLAPSEDTFTYTVPGRPYLDMEWLYQAFLYLGYRVGGYGLLSLGHTALALFAFFVVWLRLRFTGVSTGFCVFLFTAALLASENRFRVRPEILTWVLMGLMLLILENKAGRGRRFLFLLPVLQWIWVNTEGLFFIGWGLMGAFCLTDLLQDRRPDRKLLNASALALAASLLNPHFLRGFFFPFTFLSTLGSSDIFSRLVQEFQPPWSTPLFGPAPYYLLAYKLFSFFLLFALIAAFRKRKIHEWLLALFFFGLSFSAARNIPLFVIACAPLAAAGWRGNPWGWRGRAQAFLSKPAFAWALALFLLGFSMRVVTGAHYVSNRLTDRFGLGLDTSALPVRACGFLARNHLDGRILNTMDFGDWLDWQGTSKTFIDGRLDVMGMDLANEYTRSLGQTGPGALIARYRPDILFFDPRLAPEWWSWVQGSREWRLVYLDGLAAICLRKDYAEGVADFHFDKLLDQYGLSPSLPSDADKLIKTPPPPAWLSILRGFVEPVRFSNDLENLGIECGWGGHPAEAELFFLEEIRRTKGRYGDTFFNLGLLYDYGNRKDEAVLCMKRVLQDQPDNPIARRIALSP